MEQCKLNPYAKCIVFCVFIVNCSLLHIVQIPKLLLITLIKLLTGTMIWVESSGMFVGRFARDSEGLDGDGRGLDGVRESRVLLLEQVDSSVVCFLVVCLLACNKLIPHRLTPGWVIDPSSKLSCDI